MLQQAFDKNNALEGRLNFVEFQVLTASSMKKAVLWVVVPFRRYLLHLSTGR
jgi:hypothetical protein